jgi:ribonuclease P protein subunit POP4
MNITPAVAQMEFVGLKARVVKSRQLNYKNISGTVIDETRNTLIIRHKNEDKVIVKNVSVFHFNFLDGTIIEIDGNVIIGRPEDRLKKLVRRRW